MRNFKQFLLEAKNIKEVYHLTNFDNTKNILKHNYLRPSKNTETGKPGISTTFDKNYNWGGGGIKFVLNLDKLKKKYKTQIIKSQVGVDESEIIIFSDGPIKDIQNYIKDIIIIKKSDNSLKTKLEEIKQIIQEYKERYKL